MRIRLFVPLSIAIAASCYADDVPIEGGDGSKDSPFRASFEATSNEEALIKLPALAAEKTYFLRLRIARSGTDPDGYNTKSSCGCLRPDVSGSDSDSIALDIGIDLTNKRDRVHQTVYVFEREEPLLSVTVDAHVVYPRVRFDRISIVMNTAVEEEKVIFIFFDPEFDRIQNIRSRYNTVSAKILKREASRYLVRLRNNPPTPAQKKELLVVESQTAIGMAEATLPIRFADVSLGIAHPTVVVLGYGNSGEVMTGTLHIEHESSVDVSFIETQGLKIDRSFENRNWSKYLIAFIADTNGEREFSAVFDLRDKETGRYERLHVPVLAIVR